MYSYVKIFSVMTYYLFSCTALSNHPPLDDTPELREKFAQYHCYKLKTCTPGGGPVCGFDDKQVYLAEFEDMCTLHKVNCQKRGLFTYIDSTICDGQKKYYSELKPGESISVHLNDTQI
ncbi:uncharacterized protein LOC116774134 isoform X2 [Danaus plexippus]|uniref:uncharacterized protein LOC116774134 isoform X2 n=1 Tax=Danaus plexippus TaxID=13037 RepID=UPI002AAFB007|nr:uncharacterized protein LOC116774134 isoform X2 [Danaus plexippus]